MKILTLFDKKNKLIGIIWRLFIIPLYIILCLNLGKILAYVIWLLIMKLNVLYQLERFFSWFIWV